MAKGDSDPSSLINPTATTDQNQNHNFSFDLQNQIKSLRDRVKELELENSKLTSQISNCKCRKSSVGLSPANGLVSRGPSFAPEEDIALSHSWLDGSRDPVLGIAAKKDTLWESVTDCYQSRKPKNLPIRTTKSLQCRWNAISTAVKKLQGFILQVESSCSIDSSELDVMTKAKILYGKTESGKKGFTFDHVWPILKHVEKWDYNPYKQNYETSHSQSSQPEIPPCTSLRTASSGEMNLDDEDLAAEIPATSCNQPIRDQELAKRQKMTDDSQLVADMTENSPVVCDMIKNSEVKGNEHLGKVDNDCDKKLQVMMLQAENERRRLEYEKFDKDIKIMEKDVNTMTNPVQRLFFTNLQAKIQEKWAHE